jgi:hypothetical protein
MFRQRQRVVSGLAARLVDGRGLRRLVAGPEREVLVVRPGVVEREAAAEIRGRRIKAPLWILFRRS